jgi:aerobic carbon-monoxide dehydrogenase medium subunit
MTAELLVPTSAAEAASLFGDGDGITVFGGGTILLPEITAGRLRPARAMMLHRSGLDRITVDGDLVTIGAATPVSALIDLPDAPLAAFAVHLADREVRAAATIGGNLCAPPGRESQRGDLGAPLIALGARVRSTGHGGERIEPVEDFLSADDREARLVLEVEYDRAPRRSGSSGMRRRHAHSYLIAAVSATTLSDGSDLRLAVAGAGATAVRCRSVEASRDPHAVLDDVEPVDDAVASAAYRRSVLPVLVRQALERLELT